MSAFARWEEISGTKTGVKRSSVTHYTPGARVMTDEGKNALFVQ